MTRCPWAEVPRAKITPGFGADLNRVLSMAESCISSKVALLKSFFSISRCAYGAAVGNGGAWLLAFGKSAGLGPWVESRNLSPFMCVGGKSRRSSTGRASCIGQPANETAGCATCKWDSCTRRARAAGSCRLTTSMLATRRAGPDIAAQQKGNPERFV